MDGHIRQLPDATQSKLRSTQILTSLNQVVSELVQNSLDAGATHVDVGVDCEEWECWVKDDGAGMSRDDLNKLTRACNERRYHTSKAHEPASIREVETFGFRGEALSSAADVSCLEICSRTRASRQCWSIILKGGETLYSGPSLRWRRESHGTTVYVRDAFYNLPIRRLSHPSSQRTLELIRRDVETFALVFPCVSFTVESSRRIREGRTEPMRILAVPKTSNTLAAFRHLFGRTFVEHVDTVHESRHGMSLDGFISLQGAHSKAYQYIYLNRHLLTLCGLHHAIKQEFSQSSFARHALDEHGERARPQAVVRKSPRKFEKKPIFVFNLIIPPNEVDNCLEPAKAEVHLRHGDRVVEFIVSVVKSFLVRHGFVNYPARKIPSKSRTPSPRKRRRVEDDNKRISSLDSLQVNAKANGRLETPLAMTRQPWLTMIIQSDNCLAEEEDSEVVWTDPHTGMRYAVDSRSGNSHPLGFSKKSQDYDYEDPSASENKRTIGTSSGTRSGVPEWINRALATNQAYIPREPTIPSLQLSSVRNACSQPRSQQFAYEPTLSQYPLGDFHVSQMSARALRTAQVLGQVDKKFIACIVELSDSPVHFVARGVTGGGRGLILIDQHAADERVRVERFLGELCSGFLRSSGQQEEVNRDGVKQRMLSPVIPVLLTLRDAERIVSSVEIQTAFRRWGFSFREPLKIEVGDANSVEPGFRQVLVEGVPDVVGEKASATQLLMDNGLCDILKGFLAHFEAHGYERATLTASQSRREDGDQKMSWQKAMRWCPKELLDLVNSKACRGAVMFNDSLTIEQCRLLVHQLAETAFPFQCAHGRPSVAPLINISGDWEEGQPMRRQKVDWSLW
ncbi:hypothetical protein K474DRAFT_1585498 [Panus rudis PR-1116 ss-1]|nr:hypothetical protein K474DRAFT_1585498 [Panus rudis PR-1116 ss-1]